jgi:hypothetical protein
MNSIDTRRIIALYLPVYHAQTVVLNQQSCPLRLIFSIGPRIMGRTENLPLLDCVTASNLASRVDDLCPLYLAHLSPFQLGWLREFKYPLRHCRAGLQKDIGDTEKPLAEVDHQTQKNDARFQERSIVVCEVCDCLAFPPCPSGSAYMK